MGPGAFAHPAVTAYAVPQGGDLPKKYCDVMDPFVGTEFKSRFRVMQERVEAMSTAWPR
ncbi:MAG: hypothetical protein HY216_15320 [Candidatus Rokubacteria bacterium]|nr:hypothetical protein [Candidatus Rokubacteria bacterium]